MGNRVLLLEPCHAKDPIVVGNIGDNEITCMASLCSGAIAHPYHLPYDHGSTQQFAIDDIYRGISLFLDLTSSCLYRCQSKLICDRRGDEVVEGAQVNERQIGE